MVGPDEVADVAEDLADQWVVGESETSTWSRAQPFKSGRRGLLLNPGDVEGDSLLNSSLGRVNTAFIPGRGYIFGRGKAEKYRLRCRPNTGTEPLITAGLHICRICGPAAWCRRLSGTQETPWPGGRAHRKVPMSSPSPLLRSVSTTAAAAVLALSAVLAPAGPAVADSPEPSTTATVTEPPAGSECERDCGWDGQERKPAETATPPKSVEPPVAPEPVAPAPSSSAPVQVVPAAPSVVPVPAEAPDPEAASEAAAPETVAPEAAITTPSTAATAAPSGASNWNTPVTRSAQATRVAAVSAADDAGSGGPALLPIVAGLLLVGAAGASFAWWGRNRLGAH